MNIKVYIKIDDFSHIVEINSDIFIKNFTGWIKIDEGCGDKYAHAQSQYLSKPLINENGEFCYKYINGKVIQNVL